MNRFDIIVAWGPYFLADGLGPLNEYYVVVLFFLKDFFPFLFGGLFVLRRFPSRFAPIVVLIWTWVGANTARSDHCTTECGGTQQYFSPVLSVVVSRHTNTFLL
ncbi:hypothetical protein EA472_08040 [Natrarchaeobius oligotrophus]|uniref:Uncharacterized protein n=1 Tax=Natrarchaeobius chitinivorans TaxID=1679083 RepID=A0A3N6MJC3_NATCH|nr:hypothetical protein EA472_08040 [Natrarchaeobius chitinivorans]